MSRDPVTGEQGYKAVLQTFVTHPDELCHITYSLESSMAAGDDSCTLSSTGEHPFFVVDRDDFVPAAELKRGDVLLLSDGMSVAHVTDIQVQRGPPAGAQSAAFTTYNFEVADWHTYFVGESGVWVHNAGRSACERAFALIERVRMRNPGISRWDAFVETLNRTNTPGRKAGYDPVMSEVVATLMREMYKDAVRPDGTVDFLKVKKWKEIQDFRFPPNPAPDYIGKRLWGLDLHNHQIAPKEWVKKLLETTPPYNSYTPEQWEELYGDIPGFLVNKHFHTNNGEGIANFHDILKERMRDVDAE